MADKKNVNKSLIDIDFFLGVVDCFVSEDFFALLRVGHYFVV